MLTLVTCENWRDVFFLCFHVHLYADKGIFIRLFQLNTGVALTDLKLHITKELQKKKKKVQKTCRQESLLSWNVRIWEYSWFTPPLWNIHVCPSLPDWDVQNRKPPFFLLVTLTKLCSQVGKYLPAYYNTVKMPHFCLANKLRIFTMLIFPAKLSRSGGLLNYFCGVLVLVVAESGRENMTGICESSQARGQGERKPKR